MRAWLSDQHTHEGIDLGLIMQNTFMYNFCRQLFRRLRTMQKFINTESYNPYPIFSRTCPRYNAGNERVDPALVRAETADVPVKVRGVSSRRASKTRCLALPDHGRCRSSNAPQRHSFG
jgi:hypothetical protein